MRLAFIILSLITVIEACQQNQSRYVPNAKSDSVYRVNDDALAVQPAGNFSSQVFLKFDSLELQSFFTQYPSFAFLKNNLYKFYNGRNFALAWYDANGQIEQASDLFNRIQNLSAEGISAKIPYIASLDSSMENAMEKDKSVQLKTELLLTSFYFYYARKVWAGLDEKKTNQIDWYIPRKQFSYNEWLDSLLQSASRFNKAQEPVYRQYHLLKQFLKSYRDIEKDDTWKVIKVDKKTYSLQDSSDALIQIRKRLFATGDLKTDTITKVFDTNLSTAVRSFQQRYGMKKDGIIGQEFLSEMNIPIHKRIEQIMVNMERSRWLPIDVKGDYLAVNIPEFTLHAYKDDSLKWDMKVVVGKSVNKTVIFSGDLKYVVFSPYWNVPASILKNEVLPGIRRNKNYLAAHHMEWYGNSVRQTPGPWNSLGAVKFLFPNSFSIYLHDTPSKNLFNEDKRAFSHGCIRIAEPKKLALYLLRSDSGWNDTEIIHAMSSGKERYVTLKNIVPVFITYFTAWVDREGKLNFRNDVYNRDSRLAEMIIKE